MAEEQKDKKLKMHSPDRTAANIEKLAELFPNCVTEARDEAGNLKRAIDFDQLRQELSENVVDGPRERYQLNWPGKREALLAANAPIAKTLRPCRDESVEFDATKNLFIEGDNLDALKLIQETYQNRVKMIYIDPPYNTGREFIYDDDFAETTGEYLVRSQQNAKEGCRLIANTEANGRFHSDWISMMYSRIRLAKNLLSDDGAIFISIDDNEVANLRRVCDEIFGDHNFIATVVWEKVHTRKNSAKRFSISHDYVVIYGRNKEQWDRLLLPRENTDAYRNPDNDPKGPWKPDPVTAHNPYSADYKIEKPNGVVLSRPAGRYWAFSEEAWKAKVEANEVIWGEGDAYPMIKRYLSEVQDGLVPITLFSRKFAGDTALAKKEVDALFDIDGLFDYPKPTSLIMRLMQTCVRPNDLVLDFFAGSGTTAHAVMEANSRDGGSRRYIMMQLPEECEENSRAYEAGYRTIADLAKERIRRAAYKIKSENPGGIIDIGFRTLKVESSSMKDVYYTPDAITQEDLLGQVDNIKEDRTGEDLLFQVLLDWGVDLSLPIKEETIAGKQVYFVDENALAACFETGIDEDFVKALAEHKPLRAVFRDGSYGNDSTKINVEQIFKLISPTTEVKTI